jgi:DNA-binding NarL/FixJ family response regulator
MNINSENKITVGLVDDHVLLRKGLASLLVERGFDVMMQADNGKDFTQNCRIENAPRVLLLDIAMPIMDGYQTAKWVRTNLPETNVLALSVLDDEYAIIRMLQQGARGYILKDCQPEQLITAIQTVAKKGFYHNELVNAKLIHSVNGKDGISRSEPALSEKELQFLRLSCSEMTYKEVAQIMKVSPRTVDGYRDILFEKLGIHSRVGLAIYAIRHRLVTLT